jgi:nicotinamide-nucleotide amidase
LTEWFATRNYTMGDTILRQADVPTGALALPNANGTAPGLLLEKNGTVVVALPGPPNELIPLFETSVYPYLLEKTAGERQVIRSRTLRIVGWANRRSRRRRCDLMSASNPSVAPVRQDGRGASAGDGPGGSETEADAQIAPVVADIKGRLGDVVYGEDETTLEQAVVALLTEKKQTSRPPSPATGGTLSGRITSVPGSSAVFNVGLTTYSNDAKIHLLKIPSSIVGVVRGGLARSGEGDGGAGARTRGCRLRRVGDGDRGDRAADSGESRWAWCISVSPRPPAQPRQASVYRPAGDVRLRSTQAALDLLRKELLKP